MSSRLKCFFGKITLTSLSIFALLIIYSQSGFVNFLIFLFSIFIHEISHLTCAKLFDVKINNIKLLPFGAKIAYSCDNLRIDKALTLYLSGPISNFIFAGIIVFSSFYIYIPSYDFFIFYNILIGTINLIPTIPLDASKCIFSLLNLKFNKLDSFKYTKLISIIVDICILLLGIYVILLGSRNVLLIFLSIFLLNNIKSENEKNEFSYIKENKILNNIKLK